MWFLIVFLLCLFIFGFLIIHHLFKEASVKSDNFSIQYYPLTEVYVTKNNGYYLRKDPWHGMIEQTENYYRADRFKSKDEAEDYIKLAKEQMFKVNVVNIPYVEKK